MSFLFHTSGSVGGRSGQPPRSTRPGFPPDFPTPDFPGFPGENPPYGILEGQGETRSSIEPAGRPFPTRH